MLKVKGQQCLPTNPSSLHHHGSHKPQCLLDMVGLVTHWHQAVDGANVASEEAPSNRLSNMALDRTCICCGRSVQDELQGAEDLVQLERDQIPMHL